MDDHHGLSPIQHNDGQAGSQLGHLASKYLDQNASESRSLQKNSLEGGIWGHICYVQEARGEVKTIDCCRPLNEGYQRAVDCVCPVSTPNTTPAKWTQLHSCQPNLAHFECASTPSPIVEAFFKSHICQRNPTCAGCISTPNPNPSEFTTFKKPDCCRSHVSTFTLGRTQMDRANLVAELNALKERYSTLALALTDYSSTTLHYQDGYALPSPGRIDDDVAIFMNRAAIALSSDTDTLLTGPEGYVVGSAEDLDAKLMENTSQTPSGYALRINGALEPEAPILNQETPPADRPLLDTIFGDNIESELQDFFNFNAASFQLGFDAHDGVITSVAERATEVEPKTTSTLSNIPNVASGLPVTPPAVDPPAVGRTEPRHHCQSCMRTFRRSSDRDRHALSHNPNARRYPCSFPGCNRVGKRGFLRKDKLTQHQAHMRH